jgi:hypothetical protein
MRAELIPVILLLILLKFQWVNCMPVFQRCFQYLDLIKSEPRGEPLLHEKFIWGTAYQDLGLLQEAETHFLEVVAADPNDWEAHERLVQIYESQGRTEERDAEIEILRLSIRTGLAWRSYYCRDVFRKGTLLVRAMEYPFKHPDGRKTILFLVSGGNVSHSPLMFIITRSEEIQKPRPTPVEDGGELLCGYELYIKGPDQSRVLFFPLKKPEYSDIKNILMEMLEGA